MTHHLEVREREFAVLDIPADPRSRPEDASAVLDEAQRVKKLEDGFFSISARRWMPPESSISSIITAAHLGWSQAEGLTVERDNPLDPVNLAFDKSGNLLVLSSAGAEGTVYSFRPGSPADR